MILSDKQINSILGMHHENSYTTVGRRLALAQAAQTMEEFVSWASEACPHAEGDTKYYKRVCDLCWQEKLREWGII